MTKSESGKLGYEKAKIKLEKIVQERKDQYFKNPNYCIQCNNRLDYKKRNNKYCTKSCAAIINGSKFPKRTIRKSVKCIGCCAEIKNTKFCNNLCQMGYYKRCLIEDWLNRDSNYRKMRPFVRNYLIERSNNRCEECGWSKIHPITKRLVLEINHIDGNHKNNSLENLKVLCPNCHALTPNYKALNKGNGRKGRTPNGPATDS